MVFAIRWCLGVAEALCKCMCVVSFFSRRGEPLGPVVKLRLRRPRELSGILDGCITAPEENVDRILQLQ